MIKQLLAISALVGTLVVSGGGEKVKVAKVSVLSVQPVSIAGAIRNSPVVPATSPATGVGWGLITASSHKPLNLASVDPVLPTDTVITVRFGRTFVDVGAVIVGTDEEFSRLYRAGSSVGLDHLYIKVYDAVTGLLVLPYDIVSQYGNFWISGTMWETA